MKVGFLICGPSGVGKTSHVDEMLKKAGFNMKFLRIDPDQIAATSHKEQSELAFKKVAMAIREGKSFVYTATCAATKNIIDMIKDMKNHKFRTVVAISYTSLGTALERIKNRVGQPVPDNVVEDLHKFFTRKAERFMTMSNLDEIYLYNNEKDFNLLLSKKHKKILCSENSNFYFDISKYC